MIRLEVIDQITGQLKELDTFGNENINLTLQVDDVRNIESKNASYSKEFDLPATKRNNKFFEHFYDINRYNQNFNPYKNVKAFLYVDELLILEGFLRLVDVLDKSTEISYTVVLFNDVANIIETLGDTTIKDLDFSDIKHEYTAQNVANTHLTGGGVNLTDGGTSDDVYYPIINIGTSTIIEDLGTVFFDFYGSYAMHLRLKYVIDKIFEFAGFTYESDFFNSNDFKNIYLDTDVGTTVQDAVGETLECDGLDSNLPLAINLLGGSATVLNWTNESNDLDNAFDHDTSTYTAQYNTMLTISLTVDIVASAYPATASLYLMGVYFDSNANETNTVSLSNVFNYIVTENTLTFNANIDLNENDTLQLFLYSEVGGVFSLPADGNYSLSITNSPQQPTESVINQSIGDITLSDILKDVTKMFNLTFESLGNNALKIETYNDYISNYTVDWSKKVNVNEFKIEPIEAPKRIEFHHAEESNDFYQDRYLKTQDTRFGSHIIELDVDSQDIVKIENSVFAAPYVANMENTSIYTHTITQQDGENFKPYSNKSRLVYKPPAVTTDDLTSFFAVSQLFILNSSNTAHNFTSAATFSSEHIFNTNNDNNSLLYGLINTVDIPIMPSQPLNTLFNKYWFTYINERYNVSNSVILKIEANLTPTDVFNFSFANKVRIQEQLYRVNKIEYNTNRSKLSKLELLRI